MKDLKECLEYLKNNIDTLIKKVDENDEKINIYITMSEQVLEKLNSQLNELKRFRDNNITEIWKKHILENRRYGYEELYREIEEKIKKFDEKLKEDIEEFEKEREKILKANKKV